MVKWLLAAAANGSGWVLERPRRVVHGPAWSWTGRECSCDTEEIVWFDEKQSRTVETDIMKMRCRNVKAESQPDGQAMN